MSLYVQIDDEALARQLQEEEVKSFARERGVTEEEAVQNHALLAPMAGHRTVQRNVISDLAEARERSTRFLICYMFLGILEIVITASILGSEWDNQCDQPLKWWLIVFGARHTFFIANCLGSISTTHA